MGFAPGKLWELNQSIRNISTIIICAGWGAYVVDTTTENDHGIFTPVTIISRTTLAFMSKSNKPVSSKLALHEPSYSFRTCSN